MSAAQLSPSASSPASSSPSASSPLRQAFLALQEAQERIAALEAAKHEAIAVVGVGCRIPGARDTCPEAFWELLAEGRGAISAGLPQRWRDTEASSDGVPEHAHHAGLLPLPDQFDAEHFGISPREAAGMDPQQRLLLEVSWEALEHAGIAPASVYGSATGVYVGICTTDYSMLRLAGGSPSGIDGHFASGIAHSTASGRISYLLGLRGPCLSIDTACSSSLVAVHLAVEALRHGECDLALAGGVNLILSTEASRAFAQSGMLSSDGRCKAFAAAADGFVRGEGCGVVVLKRLRDAVASGDRILAVIRGSAVNHDGPSSGLTVPNGLAQQALLRDALRAARMAPADVGYIEAHGTGTALGDPIEAEALGAVMSAGRPADAPLLIASVKTNVGHLEAASGVVGLIKVVLALRHRALPGQLHFDAPSPHIRWDALKLRVLDRLRPWEPINGRRIAGVSSFGFSGTNAHVLLEEAAPEGDRAAADPAMRRPFEILPLSARMETALRALAGRYVERLRLPADWPNLVPDDGAAHSNDHPPHQYPDRWPDLCHTAAVGRSSFGHRLSVRGADAASGRAALEAFLAGQPHPSLVTASVWPGARPRVGLLFTGQGSQYPGMGRALHAHSPSFRRLVERAETVLAGRLDVPLGAVMRGEHPDAAGLLSQTLYTQPALYVLEYALAEFWRALGVQPIAVLGHSLGEYAGCAFAGVFSFEDGLSLVADRARLMHGLVSDGAMLVVSASEADIAGILAGRETEVSLAGINAASQVTVSGARHAIEAIAAECTARGWRVQKLPVSQAFHSPLMEPIGAAFEARASELTYAPPRLPVISNLTGAPLTAVSASYWRAHMRHPVRFSQGLETLDALGCDVLIEVGPRPVLIQFARQAASRLASPAPQPAPLATQAAQAAQSAQVAQSAQSAPRALGGQAAQVARHASPAAEPARPAAQALPGHARAGEPSRRRYLTSLKGPGTDEWESLCQAVQELHAAGAEIDWSGWNRDYPRRKVDAPTYPFERQRHWISRPANTPGQSRHHAFAPGQSTPGHAAALGHAIAHPLLGIRLRSALAGGQFDAGLAASGETAWLANHRIGGQAVMPATALIEMMLAAGEAVYPKGSDPQAGDLQGADLQGGDLQGGQTRWRSLEALSILSALNLPPEGARTVQTVVDEARDGRSRVRVFAAAADAAGVEAPPDAQGQLRFRLHAEARLVQAEAEAGQCASANAADLGPPRTGPTGAGDLAAARTRCTRHNDGEAHYQDLTRRGADFGPAFRGVKQLWAGEGEAIGEIVAALPPLAAGRPHPAVLDACLQVAVAVLAESADSFVPVALDRFEYLAVAWPDRVIVHARLAASDPLNPELDLTVYHPDGERLARLHRLRFHNITRPDAGDDLQSWMYELGWHALPAAGNIDEGPADCIVVGAGGIAAAVAAALKAAGRSATICSGAGQALEGALAGRSARRIVFVPPDLEHDAPESGPIVPVRPGIEALLSAWQRHGEQALLASARLYVVTRKVHAVRPNDLPLLTDAALSGLAATLFNEFPAARCTRVDIDPGDADRAGLDVAREVLADAPEDWVAYRDGHRFVARLRRAWDPGRSAPDQGPVRLVSEHGLDGLAWRPAQRRRLEPDEVEIEVRAAPLNFHDVASVVGLIDDDGPLGGECAGVVARVGQAVTRFQPGDAVVALAPGSFASFAITRDVFVTRKPAMFSFETASAQSLVYMTADHCLNEIAKLRPGDRVLIHAAAGGVGLAAVQLCRRAGAEIYATAGSEAKRAYLRGLGVKHVFSSRSLEFAAEIRRKMGGNCLDVVLNSLSGGFIDAGLSLLCPGGRFIEIGKTGKRDPVAVEAEWPGVVYQAVDLADRLLEQPGPAMARLDALFDAMAAGEIQPVPHRTHDFTEAKEAFRELASARHIGKLVLTPAGSRTLVRADGAYIVTGGAAGVGFATAQWLAEQGAGRVILLSRTPPAPDIGARIAQWHDEGVDMRAVQGDVGTWSTVAALVAETGSALRGVIHCANVLEDAPIGDLTWNHFEKAMHAKALGAWHLHRATAGRALDFFVMFGSWASIAGTRGGAAYAAANMVLDSLAQIRRHQGLPALSIDWGAWADIGWASRLGDAMPARPGFNAMKPQQALEALAFALRHAGSAQVAIAHVDWPRLIPTLGRGVASVWHDFVATQPIEAARASIYGSPDLRSPTSGSPGLVDVITGSPPAVMRGAVVARLQAMAAATLGVENPGSIDPHQPLQDIGLDSIMAVDLRNTLAWSLGGTLPATLLFDHPTINSLAAYCIDLILRTLPAATPEPEQEDSDGLLALIEGLSDDEVDARLLSRGVEIEA